MTQERPPLPLTRKTRRLFAQIRHFEAEGISGRQMLRRLRAGEFEKGEPQQISDHAFYQARRLARQMKETGAVVQRSRTRAFEGADLPLAPFSFGRGQYQFVVEIQGRDFDGEIATQNITVSSDSPITKADILRDALTFAELQEETYGIDLTSDLQFRVLEAWRNLGAP